MTWSPWLVYKISLFGKKVLSTLDYAGEKLADGLGLTSPKYEYEINQFKKQQAIKEREEKIERENSWVIESQSPEGPITTAPSQSSNQKEVPSTDCNL
jgi:hypothetical protein